MGAGIRYQPYFNGEQEEVVAIQDLMISKRSGVRLH